MNLLDIFNRMGEETTDSLNDRVLIIDGLNTYLRIFSSVPVISENGEHVGGIIGTLRSIAKEIRDFNPTRCIVVFDGKGGSMRRKKVLPQYKENRVGKYNLRRDFFSTKDEEDMARHKQLIRVIQYLDLLPVQVICMDNIEADDVIANMTMQYFNTRSKKIRIVSTDRDFLQLVSEQVEVYSPVKKKLYNLKEIEEEFGIHPKNYLIYRVLNGDDSDNIPGVNGVGLKTLIKFYPEVVSKEIDLEYLIDHSTKVLSETKKPAKIYKTVIESRDILERNMTLMQLQDTDISSSSKVRILEILQQPINRTDKAGLKILLTEDYLHTSFSNFDGWLNSTFNTLSLWSTK
jgi:DNA polymerase-1